MTGLLIYSAPGTGWRIRGRIANLEQAGIHVRTYRQLPEHSQPEFGQTPEEAPAAISDPGRKSQKGRA